MQMEVLLGKSSVNGPFSMAMFNNQRVYIFFSANDRCHVRPDRKGTRPQLARQVAVRMLRDLQTWGE